MTINNLIARREISEVLHFTTNRGLVGILHTSSLKSRARLEKDAQLEHIFKPNAAFRKDQAWLDFVNLSISKINSSFLGVSAGNWHRNEDLWWCILSFSPEILTHNGVHFATTNNIYTGVKRGTGVAGCEALFNDQVIRWTGNVVKRSRGKSDNLTTCEQAEVLYPGEIPIKFMKRIYVATEDDLDEVNGQLEVFDYRDVEAIVKSEIFDGVIA